MTRRRLVVLVVLISTVLAIVTTTAFAFRERLHSVPLVGAFFKDVNAPYWTCVMHPDVHSEHPGTCPICGMDLVQVDPATYEQAHAGAHGSSAEAATPVNPSATADAPARDLEARSPVQLDARRQQLGGVRTVEVTRRALSRSVRATGMVKADETRQADVNVKVDGWIEQLHVDYTGRAVRRGDPLFALYSPELISAQNEYLLALRSREQMRDSQVVEARQLADRMVSAARGRLSLWDLSEAQIVALEKTQQVTRTILFRSPVSGYVADKQAVNGMRVMPGQSLYRIVDLSRVWVEADVYSAELGMLKPGTRAAVSIDAFPGKIFDARLTFVAPVVDEATRTVRARFELANPGLQLRPGMFASVEINSPGRDSLIVPTDAILDSGRKQVVFVAEGDGYYAPREVKIGARIDGHVEILEGLESGQRVASSALFFLDSESQLRAALEGYQPTPGLGTSSVAPSSQKLQIELTTDPQPLKAGTATFIVSVHDVDGRGVSDAEVTVLLYMPPMPSMNMPAMRAEARLSALGDGKYRGRGDVLMAGRWDVTITVARGGTRVGSRQLTLVAR
jgi:membrane fusion protein, copper/silver efflux system